MVLINGIFVMLDMFGKKPPVLEVSGGPMAQLKALGCIGCTRCATIGVL